MKNVKRSISVILSIFFIVALVLSFDVLAENRNHECVGENCPVCAVLRISDEISDGAKKISAAVSCVIIIFSTYSVLNKTDKNFFGAITPVSLNDILLN